MSASDWATVFASGVATAVAVVSLVVSVMVARRDRPHLAVDFSLANGTDGGEYGIIRVMNDGRYKEVIQDVGLTCDDANFTFAFVPGVYELMPRDIDPGEAFTVHVTIAQLHELLGRSTYETVKKCYVTCSSGRDYSGTCRFGAKRILIERKEWRDE